MTTRRELKRRAKIDLYRMMASAAENLYDSSSEDLRAQEAFYEARDRLVEELRNRAWRLDGYGC